MKKLNRLLFLSICLIVLSSLIGTYLLAAPTVSVACYSFGLDGGNNTYPEAAGRLQAMRFQNTAGTGTLTGLELKFNQQNASGRVRLGVYADNRGMPGRLLLDAGQTSAGKGWVEISGLNLAVTQNTWYWLAFNLENTGAVEYQSNQAAGSHVWGYAGYGNLPWSFPAVSYINNAQYVMRATVDDSQAIPAAPPNTFGLDFGNQNYREEGGRLQAQRFRNTAGTGILNQLELLVAEPSPTGRVRLAVYADRNGRPGNLLLDAGEVNLANGWVSISGLNLPVAQDSYYWLAYNLQNAAGIRYQEGQAPGSHVWGYAGYGASPIFFPGIVYSNNTPYVMRATVSTSFPWPESFWGRTFGGSGDDKGYSLVRAFDGGYLIAGSTTSFGAGGSDAWLVKTDRYGIKQWDRTFGGAGDDLAYSVIRSDDGGYVFTGYTSSSGAGKRDAWLIKTDRNGNKLWERTFGGPEDDLGRAVIQSADGRYLIIGDTSSYGTGGKAIWLIETDRNGIKTWERIFDWGYDLGYSIIPAEEGGYLILGRTSGGADGLTWVIRIDSSGNELWNETYRGTDADTMTVVETADGGYLIAATAHGAIGDNIYLIKIDQTSSLQWDWLAYLPNKFSTSSSLAQMADGTFLIGGSTNAFGAGGFDVWLVNIDENGNKLWDRTFGGRGDDYGRAMLTEPDGSCVIAGYTSSFGAGGTDVWLLKVNIKK